MKLLALCIISTAFGLVLIASATNYLDADTQRRRVIIQAAGALLGIAAYFIFANIDVERFCEKWWWMLLLFGLGFIALLRWFGRDDNTGNRSSEAAEAYSLLSQIANSELSEASLVEKSFYNLGNLAFNKQQYAESIEHYKNALRRNPDNDKARENLYLAQKMLEQQQTQNQNQDQNKDQDQQNQDQNKDQNQDQNKDQNQDQNKDQNQDQQQQQQQPQDKKEQPQQQKPGQISPENAQQILKAMENAENATRARIEKQNAEKSKSNSSRRPVTNPW